MKRYRVFSFDFDSRALVLQTEIAEDWTDAVKAQWRANKATIREGLILELGSAQFDAKVRNFVDVGPRPFSILAFHNQFATQVRHAFVVGAYYPALTGAGALGERILNHLLRVLRDDYADRDEYRKVYRKDSFDNWRVPIDALQAWGVLLDDTVQAFNDLLELRNRTIHFRPETDTDARSLALEAITILDRIVNSQFPVMGIHPWFIPGTKGESYVCKAWEDNPFVKRVYLPNCHRVGPAHEITQVTPTCIVRDRKDYADRDVTDSEFVELRAKAMAVLAKPRSSGPSLSGPGAGSSESEADEMEQETSAKRE